MTSAQLSEGEKMSFEGRGARRQRRAGLPKVRVTPGTMDPGISRDTEHEGSRLGDASRSDSNTTQRWPVRTTEQRDATDEIRRQKP